jgi:hypothetical protein
MVPNPLNKGYKHTMYVIYYENPSWIEIYIDDSLYLVDKDFDALEILGGRDAYVGFTTGTSATFSSPIKVCTCIGQETNAVPTRQAIRQNTIFFHMMHFIFEFGGCYNHYLHMYFIYRWIYQSFNHASTSIYTSIYPYIYASINFACVHLLVNSCMHVHLQHII